MKKILSLIVLLCLFCTPFVAKADTSTTGDPCKVGTIVPNPSMGRASLPADDPGVKAYFEALDAVDKQNKSITDESKKKVFSNVLVKKVCGSNTYYENISSSVGAQIQQLPSFFEDKGEDTICRLEGSTTDGPNNSFKITCKDDKVGNTLATQLPVCELMEQAISSKAQPEVRKLLATYSCTEFLDPLPTTYFGDDVLCIYRDPTGKTIQFVSTNSSEANAGGYCSGILTKTGSGFGFGGFFGIVRLLYDISLPILIALAVISLVGVGVFIMYAPSGGEEPLKQAKTMAIRIFSGLMLLLRVFLGLVSADLFGIQPEGLDFTEAQKEAAAAQQQAAETSTQAKP